jgi:hypothetical protein
MSRIHFSFAAALFVALMLAGPIQAGTILGSIWENNSTAAANAIPANVPLTTPNVTFTTNSNIAFVSGGLYTIGEFLNSTPGGSIILTGAGELSNTLDNTIFNFTGTANVTNGETFTAGHDDGVSLMIDGISVINAPGANAFSTTTQTYSGPTGSFAFQLVYGECCGAPAALTVNGLSLVSPTAAPEPSSGILFSTGLLGLGVGFRRRLFS